MNPIITYITTDLTTNNNFNYVRAVQGDNQTRYVHITLLDNQIPYNLSDIEPVLRGDKPDGTTIFNHCEISDDGEIIVELTSQILASAGTGKYEIALYKTNGQNEVLTSFPFNIYVSPASFNVDNITSSNEFTELSGIIKNIDTINQNVESAKDSAKNAELSANQAATSAADASDSASQAGLSAADALSSSELSKSWAIGETGMREGEDTDNSKYYSQLSSDHMDTTKSYMDMTEVYKNETALLQESASDSANAASDKAADALNYAELSKSYAIGTEGTVREGDASDNSYYYSLQSASSARRASDLLNQIDEKTQNSLKQIEDALASTTPQFYFDHTSGMLSYSGGRFHWTLNNNGHLLWEVTI